jgi:hypothetical protein
MTVSNPASDPSALPQPRPAPNPPAAPDQKDLWRAYDLAQRHYEVDLQLFSARMNLFLFIQSALVALVAGATQIGRVHLAASRGAVASFGLALAVGWLLVASSSYLWVKTWRAHMMQLGESLRVDVSSGLFDHRTRQLAHKRSYSRQHPVWDQLESFSWFVRPTLVICCLPIIFIGGWIYLGWFT